MCIILFAVNESEQYPFILAANRDEYYSRPTAAADFWTQQPTVLAGQDLKAGGTWLGINTKGKFCAVTNHYNGAEPNQQLSSRGDLVTGFLTSDVGVGDYSSVLCSTKENYNGYGIVFGDFSKLRYQSNMSDVYTDVECGVHGLSNHFLDSPWPRVESGIQMVSELIQNEKLCTVEALFEILRCEQQDDPYSQAKTAHRDTPLQLWDMPIFIRSKNYGTRSSTVIMVDRSGSMYFEERTFNPALNAFEDARVFHLSV